MVAYLTFMLAFFLFLGKFLTLPENFPVRKIPNTASKNLLYPICLLVLVTCLGILCSKISYTNILIMIP
jgi:hypothetical protein